MKPTRRHGRRAAACAAIMSISWASASLVPASATDNDTLYTYAVDNAANPFYFIPDSYPQPYAGFIVPKPTSGCYYDWQVDITDSDDVGSSWMVSWDINGSVSTCDWRVGMHNGF